MNRRLSGLRVGNTLAAGLCLVLALSSPASGAKLRREGGGLLWGEDPIQLVGYSYYGLVGDRQFEAEPFLETLAAHNINYTRFFVILPWPVEPGPNLLPFRKTGEKYDLRQFDDPFFARLSTVVERAEQLGIICQVCLFDRCGLNVEDRRAWLNHPYNADRNVNGVIEGPRRGYPLFCRTDGLVAEINRALIKKVVETLGERNNVIYEIINEPMPQLGPLPEWHAWVAGELRKNLAGRSGSQVISAGENQSYDHREIDLFAMHSASRDGRVAAAHRRSEAQKKPLILSDDGDMPCMFNPDVTRSAATRALKLGQHFEHLEFTITLQREQEKRRAARLHEMPGLCRLNLRTLSELSTPYLARPYVRGGSLRKTDRGYVLTARIERAELARQVIGERSEDHGRTWSELPVTVTGGKVTSEPLRGREGALTQALVRVVCVDEQSRRRPGPAYVYGPDDRATALFGDAIVEAGLFRVRPFAQDGVVRRVRRGGEPCCEVDLKRRGRYAYFRLGEPYVRGPAPGTVTIEIEYFDQPAGAKLQLDYDGKPGPYTRAAPVSLGGSGNWESASFTVRDATFEGRQNDGADFRFSLEDPVAPLALRAVRVKRRGT